jgi:hypothetical protein
MCLLLLREWWSVPHARVRRLYRLEGLQVRMRIMLVDPSPQGRWLTAMLRPVVKRSVHNH